MQQQVEGRFAQVDSALANLAQAQTKGQRNAALQHLLEPDTISREVAIRAGLDFVANALDPKPE